ncbi:MAG: Isopentenyl phosphate kinase [Candidatus Roizmanbacteria bacterium GW2011_GWC2_37_13]|uniref:Isopentenyl phosphate kinase n=1 Tax=Candidatus Roizmanbacteria bacterium GW2011_GWC2_37_13 TaxID=1618486 RepID=A0A0G0G627_9BACT|nr:MAG: Isopentenyl phosphate kinase [Candidatus Roizmanbacteria bacterium GW2011_GWC1_37_12]KKQ25507.1 MAG: Isopentenyl phosphate kinase [Candidatus Roizmanbacteria bacterium GW2011_GWC2_37_13]
MKKLVLIKLGGSLISDKTKINKARNYEIKRLSKQIKEIQRNFSLIIFTGAGGFGHPLAEKYKDDLEKGLREIKNAVKKLNKIVVSSLNNVGLRVVSVEPDKVAKYKNGQMVKLLDGYIAKLLVNNITPVFHADLVDDQELGISILSMDKFLVDVAIHFKNRGFKVEKAIFLGITPGVTSEVAGRPGMTIQTITKKTFSKMEGVFHKGKGIDVTGGMKYKVKQCLRLADKGIDNYITNDLGLQGTKVTTK